MEASATLIDPSGLAVLSLSAIDPTEMVRKMAGQIGARLETEITDAKMLLADGTEIPAKVVLRDKDLDLAFVRPLNKVAQPLPALDLHQDGKPGVLDEIVILGRLGEVAQRAPYASLDRIQAIITKPRTMYVPGINAYVTGMGCPAFSLNGKVVGLLVVRVKPSTSGGMSMGDLLGSAFGGLSDMGILAVLLPAADIVEVAKQAMSSE